ncbi:MAG: hypothetical protein RBT81_08275 [Gammaproteobacteria bacterium]|jgi:Tfp pilus assembly protein PilN|nr:hypothetical protein [Gammaproteobacteria bacterium]
MAQQINFYDARLERRRDWLALHYVAGLAGVLVVLVGVSGYLARMDLPALTAQATTAESQLKAAREQIATLGARAANRKPDPRLEQELEASRTLLGARSEVLGTLRRSLGPDAHAFADYLRGFARQSVSGLWLTGFSIAAGDQGRGIEIRGRTTDPALLPEYIRRLNREAAFQGQTFAALKLEAAKSAKPAAGTAVATDIRPAWHEFTLVPVREPEAAAASAQLTQASPGRAG